MTKRIEELLNLETKDNLSTNAKVDKEIISKAIEVKNLNQSLAAIQSTIKELPQIQELNDLNDSELDNLSSKALQAYDDLMDLGMNVEIRYGARIFEVAGSMLKNAIDAKSAKLDKKLKAIDLQLRKYKIDKENINENNILEGQGYIITDRNELLKKLATKG